MTDRDRDISNRVRRGLQTMPLPEVASNKHKLDGSCSAPCWVENPGTTMPDQPQSQRIASKECGVAHDA